MRNSLLALFVFAVMFGEMSFGDDSVHFAPFRLAWKQSQGLCQFVDKGEGDWAELDKEGKVFQKFKETRRTVDFVDLFDAARGYNIRLYKHSLLIKGGKDGYHRFDDFTKFYDGGWVK